MMFGKRKDQCIYRDRQIVIVHCPECFKPRLIQHRPHWKNDIPMVKCRYCANKPKVEEKLPSNKLKDFENILDTLVIIRSYLPERPPMVRTLVKKILTEYRRPTW